MPHLQDPVQLSHQRRRVPARVHTQPPPPLRHEALLRDAIRASCCHHACGCLKAVGENVHEWHGQCEQQELQPGGDEDMVEIYFSVTPDTLRNCQRYADPRTHTRTSSAQQVSLALPGAEGCLTCCHRPSARPHLSPARLQRAAAAGWCLRPHSALSAGTRCWAPFAGCRT